MPNRKEVSPWQIPLLFRPEEWPSPDERPPRAELAEAPDVVYEISQGILSGMASRNPELDRFMFELPEPVQVLTPTDAANYLINTVYREPDVQENLVTLNVNSRNMITHANLVYRGQIDNVHIRPAEVFRPAIITNAAAIFISHNHPSGDPSPSPDDIRMSEELIDLGRRLDVEILDHLIIGSEGKYRSLKEMGLFSKF